MCFLLLGGKKQGLLLAQTPLAPPMNTNGFSSLLTLLLSGGVQSTKKTIIEV